MERGRKGGREGGRVRGSTRKGGIEKHVRNEPYSQGRRSIQEKQEALPFSRPPLQPILSGKIGCRAHAR
ncbi:hypothetical protein Naga_101797g2 [Nannochloropsis gaditana]|uniref:Uncharacterized protein n=1 Tax=Nannochloropsis gaditana TaxID=72520 RepID=W7TIK7_9STRA|nr:hypothetical protein Naga_101797g2 [Nannochloropsis gaditana]